jgi:hypothetical protein
LGLRRQWSRWFEQLPHQPSSGHIIDILADGLGKIRLSDLIGNHTSHLRATPHFWINSDDLLAGVDQVGCNIAECIKLVEATLQRPDDLDPPTQKRSEILHQPLAAAGDIFSTIDRVDQSIAKCIELAETTLHPRESQAPATAFNCNFDDFIDQLGEVQSPDLVGETKHDSKSLSALEEDLDRLLQLGEGEATARREAPVFDYFSDSDDDPAMPLLGSR